MSKEYHKGKPSEKTEEIVYKGKEVQANSTLFYFNLHLYYIIPAIAKMLASSSLVICLLVVSASSFPQLPPGIDPVSCPNYPFCGEVPAGNPVAAPAQSAVS